MQRTKLSLGTND